ncbi:TRAP transporter small permease [Halovulum dunhuangense]|uniref:TRAP transporter small permease protein n=1 Tax=Halovulum dunhuangense TaxID=1505036 RepID=A0A849L2P3_9RHOB|nr:TRAP transporter small permease [Halovulum dunhuangense]NNU80487.1 TRAP transporter small permease [Halovulum dunhuangense]
MSASGAYEPRTALGRFVHSFEETAIAVMLGLMTLITFVNVVLRYGFNSSLIWGLEVVLILFAWLVLLGMSYAVKVSAHLGVDAVTALLPPDARRAVALLAAVACLAYAGLLLKGAWDYWAPFAALPETTGRWFPTGLNENTRIRSFFETDQVPMPGFLRFLEDAINEGDRYSKLPRVVPYTMLPIAAALLLYRLVEATIDIWNGRRNSLIVSHEVGDALDELARQDGR